MALHLPKHQWGTRGVDAYEKLECIGAGTYGFVRFYCICVIVEPVLLALPEDAWLLTCFLSIAGKCTWPRTRPRAKSWPSRRSAV